MEVISDLLSDVVLPRMVPVRQVFDDTHLPDIAAATRATIARPEIAHRIRPGMSVALAVGSRGMAELPLLVRATVAALRELGATPFIAPSMGSHGGASAEGQVRLLANLGVTEASAGCPIRSSMEVVELGRLENGLPVWMDALSMQADGIVVLNRVKPHTSFSGSIESGLAKMLSIGMGNQKGAEACHALGFGTMAQNVIDMARVKLARAPVLFGLATVENAYDRIALVEAVPADEILTREPALLEAARGMMPRILFDPLDVLVVERMGKEFSGTGMDPNVTGRASTAHVRTAQQVARMVVLDLTGKSEGNANGVGLADVCTRRLFDRISLPATYANCVTSTVLEGARIPAIMDNDRDAIRLAAKTCNAPPGQPLRIVRITDTLHLGRLWISEALAQEAADDPRILRDGEAAAFDFDAGGNLRDRAPA